MSARAAIDPSFPRSSPESPSPAPDGPGWVPDVAFRWPSACAGAFFDLARRKSSSAWMEACTVGGN
eukprot:9015747-Alexandrium_andersonii.AAC.1